MNRRFFCAYREALSWQRGLVERRIAGAVPDLLLLVEHEPVITLGSAFRKEHLLLNRDEYERRGITVIESDRGGDVTYHGPGQLVAYPIVKLEGENRDPHQYLRRLEEAGIRTLEGLGIRAYRSAGRTGIWTDRGKIAAIGVHLRRWVTYHGLALNIDVDLEAFTTIVPCGLEDRRVTSVAQELGGRPAPAFEAVAEALIAACRDVFGDRFTVLVGSQRGPGT